MKIVRDGVSYELTEQELYSAYLEYESQCDFEDILTVVEEELNDAERTGCPTLYLSLLLHNDDRVRVCATLKRRNMDKFGIHDWWQASYHAIQEELAKIRSEVEAAGGEWRICSICGKPFQEGYCRDGGSAYYCSEECLHHDFTPEEWEAECEENEDSYWTSWH